MRVLVVDDDAGLREALLDVLSAEGHEVRTAENGCEALAHLAVDRPDVILLDLMMPVMSGYELRAQQLADSTLATIPVVVMTAGPLDGRARALGARACFEKPVSLEALLHTLEAVHGSPER
jgi:CheY-like chemotaxis protein